MEIMKAVVQRVASAEVHVAGQVVGRCGYGMVVLVARIEMIRNARRPSLPIAWPACASSCTAGHQDAAEGKMNFALKDWPESAEPNVLAISNSPSTARPPRTAVRASPRPLRMPTGEAFQPLRRRVTSAGLAVETGHLWHRHAGASRERRSVTLIVEAPPQA